MEYKDCHILRNIGIPEDRIHKTAVICGNKSRFKVFAKFGTNYREYNEFTPWCAAELEVDGRMILIVCHGVSGTSTAPILRELMEMGVKTIIRSGTCGTYKPKVRKAGDISISYGAVRDDTPSTSEISLRYPAITDFDVVDHLVDAAKELGVDVFLGIDYCSDIFYRRLCKPDPSDLFAKYGLAETEDLELGTLFVLCSLYGAKAGAIITIDGCPKEWWAGNYYAGKDHVLASCEKMVHVALKAAAALDKKF